MQRADAAARQLEIDLDPEANATLPWSAGHLGLLSLYEQAIAVCRQTLTLTSHHSQGCKGGETQQRLSTMLTEGRTSFSSH